MNSDLVMMLLVGSAAVVALGLLATMHVWMVPKHAVPRRRPKPARMPTEAVDGTDSQVDHRNENASSPPVDDSPTS